MNKFSLFCIVFFTSLSLVLASSLPKEDLEKAYADDYDTYVIPHRTISSINVCHILPNMVPPPALSMELPEADIVFGSRKAVSHFRKSPAARVFILHCTLLI